MHLYEPPTARASPSVSLPYHQPLLKIDHLPTMTNIQTKNPPRKKKTHEKLSSLSSVHSTFPHKKTYRKEHNETPAPPSRLQQSHSHPHGRPTLLRFRSEVETPPISTPQWPSLQDHDHGLKKKQQHRSASPRPPWFLHLHKPIHVTSEHKLLSLTIARLKPKLHVRPNHTITIALPQRHQSNTLANQTPSL